MDMVKLLLSTALVLFNFRHGHAHQQASVSDSGAILPENQGLMRRSGTDVLHPTAVYAGSLGTKKVVTKIVDECLNQLVQSQCASHVVDGSSTACQYIGGRCRRRCAQQTNDDSCEEYEHCEFSEEAGECLVKCEFMSTQTHFDGGDCVHAAHCHESGAYGGGFCLDGPSTTTSTTTTTVESAFAQADAEGCLITDGTYIWVVHNDGTRNWVSSPSADCAAKSTSVESGLSSSYTKRHDGTGAYALNSAHSTTSCANNEGCTWIIVPGSDAYTGTCPSDTHPYAREYPGPGSGAWFCYGGDPSESINAAPVCSHAPDQPTPNGQGEWQQSHDACQAPTTAPTSAPTTTIGSLVDSVVE